MKNKILLILLMICMSVSLTACTDSKDNTQTSNQNKFIVVHSTNSGNTRTYNINVSHIVYIENHYIFFDEMYNTSNSLISMYVDETMDEIMEMINK